MMTTLELGVVSTSTTTSTTVDETVDGGPGRRLHLRLLSLAACVFAFRTVILFKAPPFITLIKCSACNVPFCLPLALHLPSLMASFFPPTDREAQEQAEKQHHKTR